MHKLLEHSPTDEYLLDIYKKLPMMKNYIIQQGVMTGYTGLDSHLEIPYGVTELSFSLNRKITSIVIPDSVIKVSHLGISNLYCRVVIPESVQSISDDCFEDEFWRSSDERYSKRKVFLPARFSNQKFISESDGPYVSYFDEYDQEFGRFVFYNEGETPEQAEERISLLMSWKRQNLCRHCGGIFKGIFTKRCSSCGREKDY